MTTMTTTTAATDTTWQIDPAHTLVEFEVKHMMFARVRGRFESFEGELRLGDDGDLERSSVTAEIDAASVNTGQSQRDEHLRSADFFDVERHGHLRFTSTDVRRVDDGRLAVTGDLTIRGVTREVELDVRETGRGTDPWGGERIGFTAETTVDRTEFGLTWNQALEAGGVLVGRDVRIVLEVQAVRQEA